MRLIAVADLLGGRGQQRFEAHQHAGDEVLPIHSGADAIHGGGGVSQLALEPIGSRQVDTDPDPTRAAPSTHSTWLSMPPNFLSR